MIALDLLWMVPPVRIGGQLVVEGPHAFVGADDIDYVAWWTGSATPGDPAYCRTVVRAGMTMVMAA